MNSEPVTGTSVPAVEQREARNVVAPAAAALVHARDQAILKACGLRPFSAAALLEILPIESALSPAERLRARDSALIRLRAKGLLKETAEGWIRT